MTPESRHMGTAGERRSRRWRQGVLAALVMSVGACSLATPTTPALSGPSTLGLSVIVTASPDLLARDGATQSVITATARDANGQPVKNLALRMDIKIGGVLGDLGTLSSRNISTGSDGRANVIYTAPPPAAFGTTNETTIQVVAAPSGTDAANANVSGVSIRLTSPGVIQAPNALPVPSYFASPASPHEREQVTFDASASKDSDGVIVSYAWNFGDGTTATTSTPTVTHLYGVAADYQTTLTVTDDRGAAVTSAPMTLTVVSASNPVATFVVSPTDPKVLDTVNFNASGSSVPPGRLIVSYLWDFGDGTSATTAGPIASHIYTVAKTYTVVLTVTDDIGRRGVFTMTLTINP